MTALCIMHVKLVKQAALLVLSVASGDAVCCREASQNQQLQSPQQYGIWQVEGLGLVVAFRGTSSWDDVFVDINVRPIPLSCEGGMAQLYAPHLPVVVVPDIQKAFYLTSGNQLSCSLCHQQPTDTMYPCSLAIAASSVLVS